MTGLIPNIGPRGRQKRLVLGVVALGLSVILAAVLMASDLPRLWRIVLFLPIWLAALGLFQGRGKT